MADLQSEQQPAAAGELTGPLVVVVDAWLDNLQEERNALIMRLRSVDKTLVTYGRLKHETLGRRVR
mgnify:CR=1 FL=1